MYPARPHQDSVGRQTKGLRLTIVVFAIMVPMDYGGAKSDLVPVAEDACLIPSELSAVYL